MARRAYSRTRASQVKPQHTCRDCEHSYDWHEKAYDGSLFMCRCKLDEKTEYGKWCKFLSDSQCKHFKQRTEDDTIR